MVKDVVVLRMSMRQIFRETVWPIVGMGNKEKNEIGIEVGLMKKGRR